MRGILNPRDLESYEYVSFEPTEALRINVANGQTQRRGTPKFMVDNSNEVTPFDWYNAYLEVDFKINVLANGNDYTVEQDIATAGSGFSLINRLTASFNGQLLNDSQDMNHAVSLRNLFEFSKPYGECVAESMLHFPDTSRVADIDEFDVENAPGVNNDGNAATFGAGNEVEAFTSRNVDYNAGFARRQKLLVGDTINTSA